MYSSVLLFCAIMLVMCFQVTKKLKEKEIKRQEHIYEFILTEKHHCLTLRVMQKVNELDNFIFKIQIFHLLLLFLGVCGWSAKVFPNGS